MKDSVWRLGTIFVISKFELFRDFVLIDVCVRVPEIGFLGIYLDLKRISSKLSN
jgi:hypothetical protein